MPCQEQKKSVENRYLYLPPNKSKTETKSKTKPLYSGITTKAIGTATEKEKMNSAWIEKKKNGFVKSFPFEGVTIYNALPNINRARQKLFHHSSHRISDISFIYYTNFCVCRNKFSAYNILRCLSLSPLFSLFMILFVWIRVIGLSAVHVAIPANSLKCSSSSGSYFILFFKFFLLNFVWLVWRELLIYIYICGMLFIWVGYNFSCRASVAAIHLLPAYLERYACAYWVLPVHSSFSYDFSSQFDSLGAQNYYWSEQ